MQETEETQVQPLGREDALEEAMATHSSILAWGIPWTEEPGGLQSMKLQRVRYNLASKKQQRCNFTLLGNFSTLDELFLPNYPAPLKIDFSNQYCNYPLIKNK